MLGECDEAEPGGSIPDIHLAVIGSGGDVLAVWRVRESVHVEKVTLLFDHV